MPNLRTCILVFEAVAVDVQMVNQRFGDRQQTKAGGLLAVANLDDDEMAVYRYYPA